DGELGNGSRTSSAAPVAVAGGLSFSALAAGGRHTCGVTDARTAYCWGYNGEGELGTGSATNSATPVAVAGGLSFSALAAGAPSGFNSEFGHTCGLTSVGAVYCWGDNGDGQLGTGSATNSATPVPVVGGLSFSALATADDHS